MQSYNNCDQIHSFGEESSSGTLFLGDYVSCKNKKMHRQNNITTVITAGLGMKVSFTNTVKHRLYPLYDHPSENIEK